MDDRTSEGPLCELWARDPARDHSVQSPVPVTFRIFGDEITRILREHLDQRLGQAMFNALHNLSPELADEVRTQGIDPFYNDDKIPAFLQYVQKALR